MVERLISATTTSQKSHDENRKRKVLIVQNLGSSNIHLGFGVSATTNSFRLSGGGSFVLEPKDFELLSLDSMFKMAIHVIASTGTQSVLIIEE